MSFHLIEYWRLWVAGTAAALYVFINAKEHPFQVRIAQVIVSTGLGASTYEDIATWSGAPEALIIIGVVVLGYAALDIVTKIGRDPEFWKGIIKNRLEK